MVEPKKGEEGIMWELPAVGQEPREWRGGWRIHSRRERLIK